MEHWDRYLTTARFDSWRYRLQGAKRLQRLERLIMVLIVLIMWQLLRTPSRSTRRLLWELTEDIHHVITAVSDTKQEFLGHGLGHGLGGHGLTADTVSEDIADTVSDTV